MMAAKKGIYIFTLIGLFLGFILDYAYRLQESAWGNSSMVDGYSIYFSCICIVTFSTIFALLYTLAYNETHRLRFLLLRMMYYLLPFFALTNIAYFILYQIGPAVGKRPAYTAPIFDLSEPRKK
ncbi:MAG: hypothetical protein LEGION0403_FIIPPAGN_01677 [Legionella sp.]|uniref:hypothetical protein n=1 Tax=Legionella sp. TaxID=459 RepID=UPI003D0ED450